MKYAVFLEKGEKGYGAYSPDVPNVVATGPTPEVTLERFRRGLDVLFKLMRAEGQDLPAPRMIATTVEVEVGE